PPNTPMDCAIPKVDNKRINKNDNIKYFTFPPHKVDLILMNGKLKNKCLIELNIKKGPINQSFM
ncbi:MAG: hypothetical protein KAT05_06300, partial [Spirochaetes bacterium]|nr:hypothetical protein [Spirochaetota bacterium]